MNKIACLVSYGIMLLLLTNCSPSASFLKKIMSEHPEILTEAIEKNPEKFTEAFRKAHMQAQVKAREKAEQEEKEKMEAEFKNPKTPEIEEGRAIFGPKNAPITIVEYSDFQCPYCRRGYETLKEVQKKYKDKIRIIFKHLPLSFHPLSMPAAKRFEALAIQSSNIAYKYYELVYENQNELNSKGEAFLDEMAKKAGANISKMKKDMDSEKVKERINKDTKEAEKFEISGTPGFLINGISIKGAYPLEYFVQIIDRLLANTK